jgi:hypothetical protein
MRLVSVFTVVVALLSGCGSPNTTSPSTVAITPLGGMPTISTSVSTPTMTDEQRVEESVKQIVQNKFDSPDMARYHLEVLNVVAIRQEGNKYQAIVTVRSGSLQRDLAADVTADGREVIVHLLPDTLVPFLQAAQDGGD